MEELAANLRAHTLDAVAARIRPILADYAGALELPRGILGAAFLRALDPDAIVFAENVGPGWTVSKVETEHREEKRIRAVHYTMAPFHPLIECITAPNDPCILSKSRAERTAGGRMQDDVWGPLVKLFNEAVPEQICVHRAWLKNDDSVIYFLPEQQSSAPRGWRVISSIRDILGKGLRWPLLTLVMHDHMTRQRAAVDARLITRMLDCLPAHLESFEHDLLVASTRHRQYEELVADIVINLTWDNHKKHIAIEACRGASQIPITIVKPPTGAELQDPAKDWTNGDGNTSKHLWIISALALRQVFVDIAQRNLSATKLRQGRSRSTLGADVSSEMPQRRLYSLVYGESLITGHPDRDPLPEVFQSREGLPIGHTERGRTAKDANAEKLDKAIRDAHRHLRAQILGIERRDVRFIRAKHHGDEKCFYIHLPIKCDNSLQIALSHQVFDRARASADHWCCRLVHAVLSAD